jgi:homoserine dehydrogenase
VRSLKEACAGDRIESITGIFNGTSNFVLCQVSKTGCTVDEALTEARHLGYAEADPTADIEGFDAAAKLALLARVAFGIPAHIDDVSRRGLSHISERDIASAPESGLVYKLVGHAFRAGDRVDLSVEPRLFPKDHPLARVEGAQNAVLVEAQRAGKLSFYGTGAGGPATASAVLGDLVVAARRRVERRVPQPPCFA